MNILIVGSGGREHAIAWSVAKKTLKLTKIYCAPGNAGNFPVCRVRKYRSYGI